MKRTLLCVFLTALAVSIATAQSQVKKETVPATQHSVLIIERRPCDSYARRPAISFRNPLMFVSQAEIERQFRRDIQMILPEKVCLQILTVERVAASELDAAQQAALHVHDIDRICCEFAGIGCARDDAAELQIVRTGKIVDRSK